MNVTCPSCGVTNKVDPAKIRQMGIKCGKCKSDLEPDAPGFVVDVDQSSFALQVKQSEKPVLLDLWSPDCPPCRQLAPVLVSLAKDMVGRLKVAKINVQEQPAAASLFQVRGVPTLILLKNGKEIARSAGFQPKEQIKRFVEQAF